MAELKADFEKLFANAILYYAEGTEHHVAATELKALFTKAYGELNIIIPLLRLNIIYLLTYKRVFGLGFVANGPSWLVQT